MFRWESQEEKLLRFMRIPAKKKMEWLYQMHELLNKSLTKKQRDIYYKLREGK